MEPEQLDTLHGSSYVVLVPFYSDIDLFRIALSSLVSQTDRVWQAVVIDDSGSVDLSVEVEAVVAELDDDRISVLHNHHTLGIAGSFNRCFEVAIQRGATLAAILHADDLLEPGYIAVTKAAHRRHRDAACVAPLATVIGADGLPFRSLPDIVKHWLWPRRLRELRGDRGLRLLLRGQFLYCPAVSYRMDRVVMPAWSDRWAQVMDLELYGRVLLRGGSIALEPTSVYRYRRHAASMTSINSNTMLRTAEESELSDEFANEASLLGWRSAARAGRLRITVRLQGLLRTLGFVRARRFTDARQAAWMALRPRAPLG